MKPITLSPIEVKEALKTGEVTLERVIDSPYSDEWEYMYENNDGEHIFQREDLYYDFMESPFGKPGDSFWVRERFVCDDSAYPNGDIDEMVQWLIFEASPPSPYVASNWDGCWREASTMPQWASRLTIIHKETKVEQRDGVWVWVGEFEVECEK